MDFNKISNNVFEKSGVKLEEAVCQLVYESAEEEKYRTEKLNSIVEKLQKKIFEKDEKIDLIIKGHFEDIVSVTQYIFETSRIDKEKTGIALELLQQKYSEFSEKIAERIKLKAVEK